MATTAELIDRMGDENTFKVMFQEKLEAKHVEVANQSGACTGMKLDVLVVSDLFEGKKVIDRQRMVNAVVADQLADGTIHALTIKTKTVEQWEKMQAEKSS
uniref:BolA-like protein n=1 Tax=Eutreptiella gymnastica TaxID=73025 RepID=A0A7S1NNM6_9EUGL